MRRRECDFSLAPSREGLSAGGDYVSPRPSTNLCFGLVSLSPLPLCLTNTLATDGKSYHIQQNTQQQLRHTDHSDTLSWVRERVGQSLVR